MIKVEHLSKSYSGFMAVNDVSFECRPGRVTGFLGPNGAGKSTTMRMIAGLSVPTAGTATIGGIAYADIPNPASQIGVLLDASAQHAGRTGRETLRLAATTMGLPTERVDKLLELVGLTPIEAKRRVGGYSLGMRQRLGLASALLGDPKVLILDEPANGLDPAGIQWMRLLLRAFADQGGTVLLSSHLLGEVQQIADDLIVIGNGQIVANGPLDELLGASGTLVNSADNSALATALTAGGFAVTRRPDGRLDVEAEPAQVGRVALSASIALTELTTGAGANLESLFFSLTSTTSRENPTGTERPLA